MIKKTAAVLQLIRRYKQLKAGKKHQFVADIPVSFHVFWSSDDKATYDDGAKDAIDELYNKIADKADECLLAYNEEIKQFLDDCDALADSLNMDRHDCWMDFYDIAEGRDKKALNAKVKGIIKQQIKAHEEEIENLKKRLCGK